LIYVALKHTLEVPCRYGGALRSLIAKQECLFGRGSL
jgi:hypothetical protein